MNSKSAEREREFEKAMLRLKEYEEKKHQYEAAIAKLEEEVTIEQRKYISLNDKYKETCKRLQYATYQCQTMLENR